MNQDQLLIVEDDENLGQILKEYLEIKGFSAHLARDGEEGLTAFNQHDFDLCILDVMMPRKDGFSLAQDIRSTNKEVPIIFLTAKTMKEDVLKGYQVGADDYLNKPFDKRKCVKFHQKKSW